MYNIIFISEICMPEEVVNTKTKAQSTVEVFKRCAELKDTICDLKTKLETAQEEYNSKKKIFWDDVQDVVGKPPRRLL